MRRLIILLGAAYLAAGQYRNQYQNGYQQNQNGYQQQQGYQNQQQQYQNGYQNQQNRQIGQQQQPQQRWNQQQFGQQQQPMQQYGQQFPQGALNQAASKGTSRAVISTSPVRATNATGMGAQVTFQLRSYSNTGRTLDNATTCSCPTGNNCPYLKANEQNNCQFSFMTAISFADQTLKLIQSDFYPFAGTLDQGNWTQPIVMQVPTKPTAVDVLVQHLGVTIDLKTASLLFFNRLTLVDAFAIPLLDIDPSTGSGSRSSSIGSEMQKGNQLSFAISIQCNAGYLGKNCDLQCGVVGTQNTNSDLVLCRSTMDNSVQSCRYTSTRQQVTSCITCVNYNTTSHACLDTTPPVEAGVSHAFRTWTIVLGVLLGLALILIVCLIIAYLICRNREREEYEQAPAVYKNPAAYPPAQNGAATRQQDEWPSSPARRPLLDQDSSRQSDEVYRTTTMTTTQRQEHAV